MSKVRTFSRTFPPGHINAGKQTWFVEKILTGLNVNYKSDWYLQRLLVFNTKNIATGKLTYHNIKTFWLSLQPTPVTKHHTIRAGIHFKPGEKFSPRTWFGKPYNSPQIIFWEDLEVKYCPEFYRDPSGNWLINKVVLSGLERIELSIGDGLEYKDMLSWFDEEFHGQIICWMDGVLYGYQLSCRVNEQVVCDICKQPYTIEEK